MNRLVLIATAVMVQIVAMAQNFTTAENIPYSANTDTYSVSRCKLDVYHPTDTTGLPVVVWFHGGGLIKGEKSIPSELKKAGLVVVAVNYRLMPNVEIEGCIDDAAAAVAWTFKNIDKYGGSPHKVFVAGHSAGGYLTSMIGLDKKWLKKYGVDADSIRALIPYSGQAMTHYEYRKQKGIDPLTPTIDPLAPIAHMRKDAPPYIIICGDRELELYGRYEENAYLWRMLKLVGHPDVRIYEIGGHSHGQMAKPAHHILKQAIRDFRF